MRICAVSAFPPSKSGVADYGAFLVEQLARDPRVENVTVLADRVAGAPDREQSGRLVVRRIWERDRAGVGTSLMRAIAGTHSDVVWFNLGLTMFGTRPTSVAGGIVAPLGARLLGRRSVVTLHELPPLADLGSLGFAPARGRIVGSGAVRLLLFANDVVVTLERYRRHLVDHHRARNVRHIPHGLWERPAQLDAPPGETVLVFGMFGPHKDPGLVADAVKRLRRSRPGVRLLVAGADHPRYPGFMSACSARHALDGEWIGYVPREDLASLFARASVVVVPSTASSGSSGVIHRAVGYGRALLVSDLPDFRALAAEEDLAFAWFPPASAPDLAFVLGALLDDSARRSALVAHNLRALARLAPARTVDAYLDLFRESGDTAAQTERLATAARFEVEA
jgi:glycosyltransferase involved in cell wall biosynthesis